MPTKLDDVFLDHLEDLRTHAGFQAFINWVTEQREDLCKRLELNLELADTSMTRGEVRALRRVENGLATMINQRKMELEQEEKPQQPLRPKRDLTFSRRS
jgi:hypothetical protein